MKVSETSKMPKLTNCTRCGYVSSQEICKACVLLEGLNKGLPRLGIGKSSKVKRLLKENEEKNKSSGICRGEEDKTCLCSGTDSMKPVKINELVLKELRI